MIDELLLLSGNDIPFPAAQLSIHQPRLKEIAYITEPVFHYGSRCLTFSKESLSEMDKIGLEDKQDFEIFMSMINDKNFLKFKTDSLKILTLLFPEYNIEVKSQAILFIKDDFKTALNYNSYEEFKAIIEDMFCLKSAGNGDDYNPENGRAKKIAEKLRKGKTKVAKLKSLSTDKVAVFSNYISGLAVGLQLDINDIMNYTVYQLFDQYQRFIKKQNSDVYLQAKMAGATGLDEVDNWMDNIHS